MGVMVECGCGEWFLAKRKGKHGRCPDCALRAKRIRQEKWRARQCAEAVSLDYAVVRKVVNLTVVHDPLEVGGFAKGVTFIKEEWEQMLRHLTFTPGTILCDGQKRLYEFRLGK
jgi:hypothetical protein